MKRKIITVLIIILGITILLSAIGYMTYLLI